MSTNKTPKTKEELNAFRIKLIRAHLKKMVKAIQYCQKRLDDLEKDFRQ